MAESDNLTLFLKTRDEVLEVEVDGTGWMGVVGGEREERTDLNAGGLQRHVFPCREHRAN